MDTSTELAATTMGRGEAVERCAQVANNEHDARKLARELQDAGYRVDHMPWPTVIRPRAIGVVAIVEDPSPPPGQRRWIGDIRYRLPAHEPGS